MNNETNNERSLLQLKRELAQRTLELSALQQAASVFGAMSEGEDIYGKLAEQAAQLLDVEMCAILLYDEKERALVSKTPAYGLGDEMARAYRVPLEDEAIWKLWQESDYLVLNDVMNNPLVLALGLKPLAEALGVWSTMMVLMRLEGRGLGVIQPSNKRDGSGFNQNDIRLLSIFASQAAVSIKNARLFAQMNQALEKLKAISAEQARLLEAVRELSTPLVPVTDDILVLPLVGGIDSRRAQQIMETLLRGITERGAEVVIIDITGAPMVDTAIADHLLRATRAAALLGCQTILVGITPQVAHTIVQLGVDLSGQITRRDLQNGIEHALRLVGRRIVSIR